MIGGLEIGDRRIERLESRDLEAPGIEIDGFRGSNWPMEDRDPWILEDWMLGGLEECGLGIGELELPGSCQELAGSFKTLDLIHKT